MMMAGTVGRGRGAGPRGGAEGRPGSGKQASLCLDLMLVQRTYAVYKIHRAEQYAWYVNLQKYRVNLRKL